MSSFGNFAGGAVGGAAQGSSLGPWGAAAGGVLGGIGGLITGNAQEDALKEYEHKIKMLLKQAALVNQKELGIAGFQPTQTAIGRAIFDRTSSEAPLLNSHVEGLPTSKSAPSQVASAYNTAGFDEKTNLGRNIETSARLNAPSDVFANQNIDLGRASHDLARIGNFEQGEAAIFPAIYQKASHAGDFYKQLAALIGAAGTFNTLGKIPGANAGAGSPTVGWGAPSDPTASGNFNLGPNTYGW